jgi:exopolyphosphatase/guanosine-5'-triphosphate,3'-diphosphate pyrophosphatase
VSGSGDRVAAAIDVGSNSVLLLTVAVGADGSARAIDEAATTTRLGAGLRAGGALDPERARATLDTVVELAGRARARGARDVWAFATGAARRAAGGQAFADDLAAASGVPVEILSGAREAHLAFAAVVHGLGLGAAPVVAIDVGGATTELALGHGETIDASVSLPLGALALTDACGGDGARLHHAIDVGLATTDLPARARAAGALAAVSGGTATSLAALALGLARYDPRAVHGAALATDMLDAIAARVPADGELLEPGRAAILPAGACILGGVARALGTSRLRVSDHGVRHAYLRERLAATGVRVTMGALWG